MSNDNQDLMHRINEKYKKMSKGQKLISEYIMNNYEKAAFMTASRLGNKVGSANQLLSDLQICWDMRDIQSFKKRCRN